MLISNFIKKILLLLYFVILSGNAFASEYLDKIHDKIKFPTIEVMDNNEKPVILKFNQELKKKGYVINFWATWCVPCKKELPDLNLLNQKLEKNKIDVLTISIDKKNEVTEKQKRNKIQSQLYAKKYNQLASTFISNLRKNANIKYFNK